MHKNGSVLPALSNQGVVKNPFVKNMSIQVNSNDQSISKMGNYADNYGIFLDENIDNFAQDICSLTLLSDESPDQTIEFTQDSYENCQLYYTNNDSFSPAMNCDCNYSVHESFCELNNYYADDEDTFYGHFSNDHDYFENDVDPDECDDSPRISTPIQG